MWMHWNGGWGGWLGMSLAMVVFWGLVIWGIVAVVRATSRPADGPRADDRSPESILDERYARGEIDEREFVERRKVLSGTKIG